MADNQDDCKPLPEHIERILECEFISDDEEIRRQVFGARMFADDHNQLVGDHYPKSSFVFSERNGKRAESVFWARYCNPELVHSLGERKAETDNDNKRREAEKKGKSVPASALKIYAGYLTAITGDVRKLVPGALEVVHCPEHGVQAHSEIVLQPEFLDRLEKHFENDEIGGEGSLDEQLGRIVIRDLLVDLFCRNFVELGSSTGDDRYDPSRRSSLAVSN